ncbi:hypothetical protein [Streptomyces sp. NPDC005573]|uniref:hypothetical protein n=1 Tax=Streptomyces sp. NPDC005573 TaxID=3156890 RepID=UPI0033AD48B6
MAEASFRVRSDPAHGDGPRPVRMCVQGVERRHHACGQGLEAAGAAVRITVRAARTTRRPFHLVDRR